jgi:superfamily II RNA helicase
MVLQMFSAVVLVTTSRGNSSRHQDSFPSRVRASMGLFPFVLLLLALPRNTQSFVLHHQHQPFTLSSSPSATSASLSSTRLQLKSPAGRIRQRHSIYQQGQIGDDEHTTSTLTNTRRVLSLGNNIKIGVQPSRRSTVPFSTQPQTQQRRATAVQNEESTRASGAEEDEDTHSRIKQELQSEFEYPLDEWQLEAGLQIKLGQSVITCAPTGAGKTVVGEIALRHAFEQGLNAIYTTPLKALSNQKFVELRQLFGPSNVGLSTGDMSINRNAPIMVVTTEVYRNMAWRETSSSSIEGGSSRSDITGTSDNSSEQDIMDISSMLQPSRKGEEDVSYLSKNAVVVLDEFHYMGQRGRGGVWEECVITCPAHTQLVALSATLPNAYQLKQWMQSVTGRPTSLVDCSANQRPVPLRYLFATRDGLSPLFRDPDAGPGSPKGLLGLRGDGKPEQDNNSKPLKKSLKSKPQKRGFIGRVLDSRPGYYATADKLPRGLTLHADLQKNKAKLLTKVDRGLKRQEMRSQEGSGDGRIRRGGRGQERRRGRGGGRGDTDLDQFVGRRGGGMSPREEQRQRERLLKQEMRRSVPSLPFLVRRLQQQQLLPAIVFIFSRAGCDDAARSVAESMLSDEAVALTRNKEQRTHRSKERQIERKKQRKAKDEVFDAYDDYNTNAGADSLLTDTNGRQFRDGSNSLSEDAWTAIMENNISSGGISDGPEDEGSDDESSSPLENEYFRYAQQGLLSYKEVKEVAQRLERFNDQNDEIAFADATMQQLMLGAGSHHAGQLAAHKTFVETLFRQQLLKVIFATETLAAGINVPARTTVITSLAKRGDGGSINLLETSNLLQMAGRAGRRGMDTDGTCVLLQTPFEGPEEALTILTNPIQPITSQFSPSYTLAINLIGRGNGKLGVARALIQKSFAMWQNRQDEQDDGDNQNASNKANYDDNNGVSDPLLLAMAQEKFLTTLKDVALDAIDMTRSGESIGDVSSNIEECLAVLSSPRSLKKASKSYMGNHQLLELEKSTLRYLEKESLEYSRISEELNDVLGEASQEDLEDVLVQIKTQQKRIRQCAADEVGHPLTSIAYLANIAMTDNWDKASILQSLRKASRGAIGGEDGDEEGTSTRQQEDAVTALELAHYCRSFKILERKKDKLKRYKSPESSTLLSLLNDNLSEGANNDDDSTSNADTFVDLQSLVKVLESYGCVTASSPAESEEKEERYSITPGGTNISMLNFDNTLWALVAMGGAHDVQYQSKRLEELNRSFDFLYDADYDEESKTSTFASQDESEDQTATSLDPALPAREAEELVSHIRDLVPSELAGYVSCLVSEGSRGDGGGDYTTLLEGLSGPQQRVIRGALLGGERLLEVQRLCEIDEDVTCRLELATCEVVTEWAAGCTWNEALAMSGLQPGDLARVLHRALDALRQFGALPYNPVRASSNAAYTSISMGLHPEIRRLCRDASTAMDRYPLKDPLPLSDDDDDEEEIEEDDIFEGEDDVALEDDIFEGEDDVALEDEGAAEETSTV